MNERIRECMYNAGLNSNYVEGFNSIYSEQLEKFAELIVKECAELSVTDWTGYAISEKIKQHFGVEE
jgi:hypothetical protein